MVSHARRRFLFAAFAFAGTAGRIRAQELYPAKPIRVLVGLAAGGGTDTVIRSIAPYLTARLGQPVVVENRAGAAGIIAAEYVAKAPPDGYTLLMAPSGVLVTNVVMRAKLPYRLEDFAPITLLCTLPLVLIVAPNVPVRSLAEVAPFIASSPARRSIGGGGAAFQLTVAVFARRLGAGFEYIQYKGSNEAVQAVMAGDLPFALSDVGPAQAALRGGRLFAPARTPASVLSVLRARAHDVIQMPEVRAALLAQHAEPAGESGEAFGRLVAADVRRWDEARRAAGIPLLD